MADHFDQRGYLIIQQFGFRRRRVYVIPGEVLTRLWRFARGVSVQHQSLQDAHEMIDDYLETTCIHSGSGVK